MIIIKALDDSIHSNNTLQQIFPIIPTARTLTDTRQNSNLDPKVGADTSKEVPDAYVEAPIPTHQLLYVSPQK